MSLIDKQLKAIQIQNELNSKLAEMNYKSFNGTRQSMRNFREGTLEIGKMHFDNTPQDRITKEMVTDYHKKEEERLENIKRGKTETGLSTTIETELVDPAVIPLGSTGVPATLQDLNDKSDEITNLVNQITATEDIIRVLPIKNKDIDILLQNPNLSRTEWFKLNNEKQDNNTKIKNAKSNKILTQRKIPKLQREYELIEQNIKDNEQAVINAKVANRAVGKKYETAFNELNQNMYSVKQEPHESERDYIQRIKQLDALKYDPTLYKAKAELENSKELMKNLKQVISDDTKISEIVKGLNPDEVFDVNKYWAKIKETIIKVFGVNNKQATVNTYIEFIMAILDTIDTKGSLITVIPSADPKPKPPATPTPTLTTPPIVSSFDIVLSSDKKTLSVTNTSIGLTIYI